MHFVWFWTFWHWSKEHFRDGSLLLSPLHGVGGHWDEWFRHEASPDDLRQIEISGRTEASQRRFIAWLLRRWAPQTDWPENRVVPRFVLGQLSLLPPFNAWSAFKPYRTSYGVDGISALVLGEHSRGEPEDVRKVEAVVLPADSEGLAVVPEGFHAGAAELDPPLSAAKGLLCGKGLLVFLALWILGGRRPYPRWLSLALFLGWLTLVGLILFLLVGPEPSQLVALTASLLALWSGLTLTATAVVAWQSLCAWKVGRDLNAQLEKSQVRLRMNGGLTLKGGSAGLAFCLNALFALCRAQAGALPGSWLWQRVFRALREDVKSWAATGVVTMGGRLKPVVINPKLRACLGHGGIKHLLTPRQPDAGKAFVQRLADGVSRADPPKVAAAPTGGTRLGFAAEKPTLRTYRCRHAAHALISIGGLGDRWQMAVSALALAVSVVMVIALPDMRSILLPYPAPVAVEPASPSPYYLWVSLDTKHPEYFSVVLESGYWSNRRSEVKASGGGTPSMRAEIHLHRLVGSSAANEDDGVVWIERRRRFLTRDFRPGERVGRYSIPYLTRIGHE